MFGWADGIKISVYAEAYWTSAFTHKNPDENRKQKQRMEKFLSAAAACDGRHKINYILSFLLIEDWSSSNTQNFPMAFRGRTRNSQKYEYE